MVPLRLDRQFIFGLRRLSGSLQFYTDVIHTPFLSLIANELRENNVIPCAYCIHFSQHLEQKWLEDGDFPSRSLLHVSGKGNLVVKKKGYAYEMQKSVKSCYYTTVTILVYNFDLTLYWISLYIFQ